MVNEATEREIRERLREHLRRYPAAEQPDAVKFIFQALLGVGHLLSSREAVERYLIAEMRDLKPDSEEPLFEPLSAVWGRLNLRRALAEGMQPAEIADRMFASEAAERFTRRDVYALCGKLAQSGDPLFSDKEALRSILDETWLPSHSAAYRALYRPAYRVIAQDRATTGDGPKSILIRDTTREERERIVREALLGGCGSECEFCFGCDNLGGGRIDELYQPYIDGEMEIAEINAAYRAPFVR